MAIDSGRAKSVSLASAEYANNIYDILKDMFCNISDHTYWNGTASYAALLLIDSYIAKANTIRNAFNEKIPEILVISAVNIQKLYEQYEYHMECYNRLLQLASYEDDGYSAASFRRDANAHKRNAQVCMSKINSEVSVMKSIDLLKSPSLETECASYESYANQGTEEILVDTEKLGEYYDKVTDNVNKISEMISSIGDIKSALLTDSKTSGYISEGISPFFTKLSALLDEANSQDAILCNGLDDAIGIYETVEKTLRSSEPISDISVSLTSKINFYKMDANQFIKLNELLTKEEYKNLSSTQFAIAATAILSKTDSSKTVINDDLFYYSNDNNKKIVGMNATSNDKAGERVKGDCSTYAAQILKQVTGVNYGEAKDYDTARFVGLSNGKFYLTDGYKNSFAEIKNPEGNYYKELDVYANGQVNTSILKPGDVICYTSDGKTSTHVAIYAGENSIIEGVSAEVGARYRDVTESMHYTNGINENVQIFRSFDGITD